MPPAPGGLLVIKEVPVNVWKKVRVLGTVGIFEDGQSIIFSPAFLGLDSQSHSTTNGQRCQLNSWWPVFVAFSQKTSSRSGGKTGVILQGINVQEFCLAGRPGVSHSLFLFCQPSPQEVSQWLQSCHLSHTAGMESGDFRRASLTMETTPHGNGPKVRRAPSCSASAPRPRRR